MEIFDEREEELASLRAIYPELTVATANPYDATLDLAVTPSKQLLIRFVPFTTAQTAADKTYAEVITNGAAYIERDVEVAHLPPLRLLVSLPVNYPADSPPTVRLETKYDWLPRAKLKELEDEVVNIWEEYGHCQILFSYIDFLQQSAERGFDLDQAPNGCLVLSASREGDLVTFDEDTKQALFNAGTYDCGICLEPKKGSACHMLHRCSHIFCRQCLHDFYENAITEGDVTGIRCLSPDCGKEKTLNEKRKGRKSHEMLHPRELLSMGIEESTVRRYVEMKRKKKLEADKSTVYCPRTWCQGPAKSAKYPPIPADVSAYVAAESSSDEHSDGESVPGKRDSAKSKLSGIIRTDPADRLAICEKCSFAFCRVCYMGWHSPFTRCFPRNPKELSAEEKASYDYIRAHTSPCPTCCSPTQKTMGCNHMNCFQCHTHFCYLCGAWLDSQNPYQHFNKPGTECYQRLWELEEGDDGQGPADGRGFAGGRGWEQLALDVAREAEAAEAAAQEQEVETNELHVR